MRTEFTVKSQKPVPICGSQFVLAYKVQCRKRPKTKQTITFVRLLKARAAVVDRRYSGQHVKGGESASVLSVRVLPERRLGASGGRRGLRCALRPVPVVLA